MMNTKSIYKSPAGQSAIMAFYDNILAEWPVPHKTFNIDTRYGQTFVIASGAEAAPPLVLLHGSSTNSAMWAGDVVRYSRHYRVFAVDTLGEPGKSAPNRPSLKSLAYAEWLADLFDALKIQQAVVIGCSQGGWLALRLATRQPERVTKLILLCPGGVTPVRFSSLLRIIALSLFGRWGAESIKRLVYGDVLLPDEVLEFADLIQNHYNPRTDPQPLFTDEELRRLTMPTLLVAGDQDCFYVSAKTAARLKRLLPNFSAVILPEAGHVLLDTPAHIMPFLANGDRA
jgi:pimeloyl-ACP methyl ester carboxylesterase